MNDSLSDSPIGARAILSQSLRAIAGRPFDYLALFAAALVSPIVAIVWGTTLTWVGWMRAREEMPQRGLMALGEVLAPARGRQLYRDGVWRGLWRAHGATLALALLQAPVVAMLFLPAVVTFVLLKPTATLFPNMAAGMATSMGIPAIVALGCMTVVLAQTMLVWRIVGSLEGPYSLGVLFKIVSAAWEATLTRLSMIIAVAMSLTGVALVFGAFIALNGQVAGWLELGAGGSLVVIWLATALGVLWLSWVIESVAQISDSVVIPPMTLGDSFRFSDWLVAWLSTVFGWFRRQGMLAVGTGTCLVIGFCVALLALATGRVFESWVALGWFAVSATVLTVLKLKEKAQ